MDFDSEDILSNLQPSNSHDEMSFAYNNNNNQQQQQQQQQNPSQPFNSQPVTGFLNQESSLSAPQQHQHTVQDSSLISPQQQQPQQQHQQPQPQQQQLQQQQIPQNIGGDSYQRQQPLQQPPPNNGLGTQNGFSNMPPVTNHVVAPVVKPPEIRKDIDKNQILTILGYLKKVNLTRAEQQLLEEVGPIITPEDLKNLNTDALGENAISSLIYKSDGNPNIYEENYKQLLKFVDGALDSYRHELSKILYPVFVHMYLELVSSDHSDQAISFMKSFGLKQEFAFTNDIQRLALVTKKSDFAIHNDVIQLFRDNTQLYTIKMSRDSHNYLKRFLQDKSQSSAGKAPILVNIIQEHLFIDVYDGLTRSKASVDALSGGMFGEAARETNRTRVFYGLLKEPDLNGVEFFDVEMDFDTSSNQGPDGGGEGTSIFKKKKFKKDPSGKKARNDPNAPTLNRIPIPELREKEKKEKAKSKLDSQKAKKIGADSLPSVCLLTVLNAHTNNHDSNAICAELSEDGHLMAAGFGDSSVRVWPLATKRIKILKPAHELENLDREAEDVMLKMFEEQPAEIKILYGHSGPVFCLSFCPFKDFLISGSEDATIRLWSLYTWTTVVVLKGHVFPVWGVHFSPHGHYFASCSHDRTARLWSTDSNTALRIFAGHHSDVDCVQFHPNSNYIATASTDRSIRLWDCFNGDCVRLMTGHKDNVKALIFENSGRFLISAGADKRILVWDIPSGHLVAELFGPHTDTVFSLAINRLNESIILASGGLDNKVVLWDMAGLLEDLDFEELTPTAMPTIKSKKNQYLLGVYPTKSTMILANHFTRRNILVSVGSFQKIPKMPK